MPDDCLMDPAALDPTLDEDGSPLAAGCILFGVMLLSLLFGWLFYVPAWFTTQDKRD